MAKTELKESKVRGYLDKSTGEVVEQDISKIITVTLGKKEEFYMTYCNYLASIYELKYADDIKMLIKMCQLAEFDSGIVYLTAKRRAEIVKELNIHTSNISKSLNRLKDKAIIVGDNQEFVVSPVIFWKGDKGKRMEILRKNGLSVTFNFQFESNTRDL